MTLPTTQLTPETVHDFDLRTDLPNQACTSTGILSFVIPIKDEIATLRELRDRIIANTPLGWTVEIIFIDDGSKDGSWEEIERLTGTRAARVRGIRFRYNRGKAAALTAGFRAATGDIVFTMDGDLQDDPVEIPAMLAKLDEGYDVVSGWKKVRRDPWHKVFPSRVFNWMLSRVCGVALHDHNCGYKCYRAEVTRELTLHGELHRMIPSIAAMLGYCTAEIPVQHNPRRHGKSKYGFERYLRGLNDMLSVGFLQRFRERPSHFMGSLAMAHLGIGSLLLITGLFTGLSSAVGMVLTMLGGILAITASPLLALGFACELMIRGGLAQSWNLPIDHDTGLTAQGLQGSLTSSCQPIATTYLEIR